MSNLKLPPPSKTQPLGPLSMPDARQGSHSHTSFLQSLVQEKLDDAKIETSLSLESLRLDPQNIARLVP